MANERTRIANPVVLDQAQFPVTPLLYVAQATAPEPAGVVQRYGNLVLAQSPWRAEITLDLGQVVLVAYILPIDDGSCFIAACIDQTFEPIFQLMSEADRGDDMIRVVAENWPDIHQLLRNGNAGGGLKSRALCNVATAKGMQWAVVEPFEESRSEISPQQVADLAVCALTIVDRISQFGEIPALLEILARPTARSRRADAALGLVGSIASLLKGIADPTGPDLAETFRSAAEIIEHTRSVLSERSES